MSNKGFYTVPFVWNKTLWVITFLFFILWIGLSAFMLYVIFTKTDNVDDIVSLIALNLVMLPTMIACEGLAPQRLEIGEERIVILRRYKSVVINRSEIKSVQALSKSDFNGAVRTFGVGGLFGFFGRYHSNKLGSFRLYATSFENLFLVKLWNGKSIVFSCSEPDKMNSYLN